VGIIENPVKYLPSVLFVHSLTRVAYPLKGVVEAFSHSESCGPRLRYYMGSLGEQVQADVGKDPYGRHTIPAQIDF
jgi:hypothetical protein